MTDRCGLVAYAGGNGAPRPVDAAVPGLTGGIEHTVVRVKSEIRSIHSFGVGRQWALEGVGFGSLILAKSPFRYQRSGGTRSRDIGRLPLLHSVDSGAVEVRTHSANRSRVGTARNEFCHCSAGDTAKARDQTDARTRQCVSGYFAASRSRRH